MLLPVFQSNLALMRQIDKKFLETPLFGVRQMTWHLRNGGHLVNEKRMRGLMGLMPKYQKPNTIKAAKEYKTLPYLRRGLRVDRPSRGLGARHHLSVNATRVPISGRHHGL